jgi:hypothetical protein
LPQPRFELQHAGSSSEEEALEEEDDEKRSGRREVRGSELALRKPLPEQHGGRKSLTAAARILDPKLSDRNAVYVPVFRRAVEGVEGNVGTWMNSVIDDFDSMHVD